MTVHFLLGGARSGKSGYAEQLALACKAQSQSKQLHYIATAVAFDDEMRRRIELHQQRRGKQWHNHEEPTELVSLIEKFSVQDVVLIDCFTLWMNNIIYNNGDTATPDMIDAQVKQVVQALSRSPATYYCVSNEVGLGIVPLGEVTRLYVDHAGWMNQAIAKVADTVTFMAAGLPLAMKGGPVEEFPHD